MTKQEEIEEELYHQLKMKEKIGSVDPYRYLPPGSPAWLSFKVTLILKYLASQGVVIKVREDICGDSINAPCPIIEPLIKE